MSQRLHANSRQLSRRLLPSTKDSKSEECRRCGERESFLVVANSLVVGHRLVAGIAERKAVPGEVAPPEGAVAEEGVVVAATLQPNSYFESFLAILHLTRPRYALPLRQNTL